MENFFSGALGGALTVSIVTFVAWMSREWIGEKIRRSVQHNYDVQLERLRGDLRVDAFRNETRFTQLHEKRAQTIADVYAALQKLRAKVADYIGDDTFNVEPLIAERRELALAALRELADAFQPREIYFPQSTANRVRELIGEWKLLMRKFEETVENAAPHGRGDWATKWGEVQERMGSELRVIFEELREEFRQLLGDEPTVR
ncbi:MAG: hypothetical protein H0T51_20445 [Pirellulales bacterium]|nr:hypothetical protein [Pirellulales bacterium]